MIRIETLGDTAPSATRSQTLNRTSVLLAENRILFRMGMRKALDDAPDIEVIHQVDTYQELVNRWSGPAGVVVIGCLADVSRPPVAARRFIESRTWASVGVLVLDDRMGVALPSAPRVGLLTPTAGPDEFLSAIRMLAAGYAFFASAEPDAQSSPRTAEHLTRRETDVLGLLVRGQTNSEMARRLFLTESTIKFHVQNLLRKLQLPNRASAVAYAYETGLISGGTVPPQRRRS